MSNKTCISIDKPGDWWSSNEPDRLIADSCRWPWTSLNTRQFLKLWDDYHRLMQYGDVFKYLFYIDYALCFFGIVGNALSLFTLTRGNFKQPSYVYHKGLAVCDLLFNALFFVHAFCHLNNGAVEKYYGVSLMRIIVKGPIFSLSLVSDFISIATATERMIGVCFATHYQKINQHKVALSIIIISFVVGFIGRLHYSLLNALSPRIDSLTNETLYTFGYSAFSDGLIYNYWYMISDTILPFLIMAAVCALSAITINAIVKRFLKKKKTQAQVAQQKNQNTQIDQQADQMRTATQLLVVSTGLCVFNQLGLISYTIAWQLFADSSVDFESTSVDVETWLNRRKVYNQVYIFQGLTENSARVMHFFMYVLISSSFRNEFVQNIRKLRSSVGSVSTQATTKITVVSKDTVTHK